MTSFREWLKESQIKVIADMAKMFVSKDRIRTGENKSKGFEQVSIYGKDQKELENIGAKIKKNIGGDLFYKIIKSEDNFGEESLALYITNKENPLIDSKRIIKVI